MKEISEYMRERLTAEELAEILEDWNSGIGDVEFDELTRVIVETINKSVEDLISVCNKEINKKIRQEVALSLVQLWDSLRVNFINDTEGENTYLEIWASDDCVDWGFLPTILIPVNDIENASDD